MKACSAQVWMVVGRDGEYPRAVRATELLPPQADGNGQGTAITGTWKSSVSLRRDTATACAPVSCGASPWLNPAD